MAELFRDFNFKEETRWGHLITEKVKKLWYIELLSLEKLKEICKKYDLKYYAIGGTLLGAVRHRGFIPWDDDIDIVMLWPDYQKLLEVAPKECVYPFFFQSYLSDENGGTSVSRLRRSDTTGFTRWERQYVVSEQYNRGIFIDVFPLFAIPETEEGRRVQREAVLDMWEAYRGYTAYSVEQKGEFEVDPVYKKCIDKYLRLSKTMTLRQMKQEYLNRCAMFPIDRNTKEVGMTAARCYKDELIWQLEWFEESVELPCEGTTVA